MTLFDANHIMAVSAIGPAVYSVCVEVQTAAGAKDSCESSIQTGLRDMRMRST